MSGTINKAMLIGRLGADVKTHFFDGGGVVCRFSLATNESFTNKEGQKYDHTEWHNIVTKNKLAEICDKYLKKGDKIYLEGKIRSRTWEDEEGTKSTTEIIASEITFLDTKKQNVETGTE